MRFADYFGRAFSAVNAAQFPWLKLFRESKVEELADVSIGLPPFCLLLYISLTSLAVIPIY